MLAARSLSHLLALVAGFALGRASAQNDALTLDDADVAFADDTLAGTEEMPDPYAPLNAALGGDSVRFCNGVACSGWVEDHFADGTVKHRGYYGEGRLLVYNNYHPNGLLEREFKAQGNTRCSMRTFHDNGQLRSETAFVDGNARTYTEYYINGAVRYTEEKHPSQPYYKVMDLFSPDGKPISTLHLADKKKVIFEQCEYWPNGQLRAAGRSQFNPQRYDSQRIGAWTYYDVSGKPVKEERYIEGKVHETADL
jgi:antitoxin component YwqK of YwqJK toxin-antitoxin module